MQVKLICGIIFAEERSYQKALELLTQEFGEIEKKSEPYNFSQFTKYYEPELGQNLQRQFLVFKRTIEAEQLPDIKLKTIELEKQLSKNSQRTVNLDPGYLTSSQFILASVKASPGKIYLAKNIWAQLIYQISKNQIIENERTFPDLKQTEIKKFILANV